MLDDRELVHDTARRARAAAHELRVMTREEKDRALVAMANALEADAAVIVRENEIDTARARENGTSAARLQERLPS